MFLLVLVVQLDDEWCASGVTVLKLNLKDSDLLLCDCNTDQLGLGVAPGYCCHELQVEQGQGAGLPVTQSHSCSSSWAALTRLCASVNLVPQ